MQLYSDSIDTTRGAPLRGATVTARLDGVLATIYDADGVVQANPLTTDSTGSFSFRAANGEYTLTIEKVGITTKTQTAQLYDPADDPASAENLASTADSKGAGLVGWKQSGTGAADRTVQDKLREYVSSSDFPTIQQAFDAAQATGKALKLVGEVQGELLVTDKSNFTIFADSPDAGYLKKVANTRAYVIRLVRCSNFFISNIAVDSDASLAGRYGCVSMEDCERFLIDGVEALAPSDDGAGILAYSSTAARMQHGHVVNSRVYGTGTSGNGVLLVNYAHSSIENCDAFDCNGVPGTSPGIGLQLKNDCFNSRIIGGTAQNCASGVAYGSDASIGPGHCKVEGVAVDDCATALLSINATYCKSELSAHYIAKIGHVIDFTGANIGNTVEIAAFNVLAAREVARFRAGSAGNTVRVVGMSRVSTGAKIVAFDAGVTDNVFAVEGNSQPISDIGTLITDTSGNTSNYAFTAKNARLILTDASNRRILKVGTSGASSSASYLFELENDGAVLVNLKNSAAAASSGIAVSTPTTTLKAELTYNIASDFWNFVVNSISVMRMFSTVFRAFADNVVTLGGAAFRFVDTYSVQFRPGAGTAIWTSGTGSPEGVKTAVVGSIFARTDGAAGTTLYIKESGAGNTGWVAK